MADSPKPAFTLGSASPRRAELLTSLGLTFEVESVDIDEAALVEVAQSDPQPSVERIARAKFAAFAVTDPPTTLLTADTMVGCDGELLGKPDSAEQLTSMLRHMSGGQLTIVTAICVGSRGQQPAVEVVSTAVMLRELSLRDIDRYVVSGVGLDKAGGLALQAEAKPFIDSVHGCWSNVLGLPLCAASRLLRERVGPSGGAVSCSVGLCGHHNG